MKILIPQMTRKIVETVMVVERPIAQWSMAVHAQRNAQPVVEVRRSSAMTAMEQDCKISVRF